MIRLLLVPTRVPTLIVTLSLALGCTPSEKKANRPAESKDEPAAEKPAAGEPHQPHQGGQPPIDCPLRKAGVDPAHMRPFEDVEDYIAFLDRADRAEWQKPDEVVAALGLKGSETVADVGAGSGYFSFRLARALPQGKVVAIDVEAEMVRHMHHKAMTEGVKNLEAVLTGQDDPAVPKGTDLVLIVDVLHHIQGRVEWLSKASANLETGARLVIIEFREGKLPKGPPEGMKIPRKDLIELARKAGFELASEQGTLLPYQHLLLFAKR